MSTNPKCSCGKAIVGKYQQSIGRCRICEAKRKADRYAEVARIVAAGTCPHCGTPLARNLALTGWWWQCGAYGEPSFRKPEHRSLPACSFQIFTER